VVPLLGPQQPKVVYWDKFGRPEIDAEYSSVGHFPDTWWWEENRAERIKIDEH
jgi:hypothetical protein